MKEIIKKIGTGLAVVASVALLVAGGLSLPVQAEAPGGLHDAMQKTQNDDMPTELFDDGGNVTTVINTMLFIVGILAVIMIIYAGIRYTTAHGDKGQVESAKNTLMYSIVGLVVAIIAYALVNWVTGLFVAD